VLHVHRTPPRVFATQPLFLPLFEEQAHDVVVHLQCRVGERGRHIEQIGHQGRIAAQRVKTFQELRRVLLTFMR
jgi:hypothetical protein